jgi:hypothetical protein
MENVVAEEEGPDVGPCSLDDEAAKVAEDDVQLETGQERERETEREVSERDPDVRLMERLETRRTSSSAQTPGWPNDSIRSPPARSMILTLVCLPVEGGGH